MPMPASTQTKSELTANAPRAVRLNCANLRTDGRRRANVHHSCSR